MERNKYLVCNIRDLGNCTYTYETGIVFDKIDDAIFYVYSPKNKDGNQLHYLDVLRYDEYGWSKVLLKPSDKSFPSSSHKLEKIKIIEPKKPTERTD